MAARSTRGVKICIAKGSAVATSLTPTAVSSAKPATLTFAAPPANVAVGDLISISATGGTGYTELDGKDWVVGAVVGSTVTLLGSDTTGSTGNLAATPAVKHYIAGDMVCLCLATLEFKPENPDSVSVATFCDPTASLPNPVVAAGTADFTGYVDVTEEDYQELLKAYEDGNTRIFRIFLPNNGYLVFPATLASFNIDLPIDGAVGYSGTFTLGSRPRHLFA